MSAARAGDVTLLMSNATPSRSRKQGDFTVKVSPKILVSKLKAQIEAEQGFPAHMQKIKYGGCFLDDRKTVGSYHPTFPKARMHFYCAQPRERAPHTATRTSPVASPVQSPLRNAAI